MSRAPAGLSLLFRPRKQPPAAIATEHAHSSGLPKVEAVLLLSGEPLSSRKLAQFAGLADGTEARTLVRRLNQLLDAAGSSFRVEEVAGGLQIINQITVEIEDQPKPACVAEMISRIYF